MSDKFLNAGGGGSDLSNGTINAFLASLTVANLSPSLPVKTNSLNTLVSAKLDIADVNNLESRLDAVITSPFQGTFIANDFESKEYFSVNDELQKIDNLAASTVNNTNVNGFLNAPIINTSEIFSTSPGTGIQLDATDVNIFGNTLTFNGQPIGDSNTVKNPFESDVDAGGFSITNLININGINVDDLGDKTQNITANNANTNFTKNATFILAGSESVVIRDDSSPFAVAKFIVANTSVQINSVPLLMNNGRIQLLGTPTANGDAVNKSYVDTNLSNVVRNPMTGTLFGGGNGIVEVPFIECNSLIINEGIPLALELNGSFLHKRNTSPLFYQSIYEKAGGILDGDVIFRAEYNTTNTVNHAGVRVLSAGDQTSLNSGCDYIIRTCLSNNTAVNDRFRIAADNHTYITGNLDVAGSSSISLNPALNEAFVISNNSTPFAVTKFIVSNTSAQFSSIPLIMSNQRITLLGSPMDNGDATNKSYVDNAVANLIDYKFSRTPTGDDRLVLSNALYSDELMELGWLSGTTEIQWVLKSMPPASGVGGYIAVANYRVNNCFDVSRSAAQFNQITTISLPNSRLTNIGDILDVSIYPVFDPNFVCPRYHAKFIRTSTDIVLTVERFNPPV